jgi:putative addiction module killer protein
MTSRYQIAEYVTASGKSPYAEWFDGVKDTIARAKLAARIDRAAHGNFGDWKALAGAKGVYEMRENYGPGYRVFYSIVGREVILLLAGSTKRDQPRTIANAKEYLADYRKRARK